MNREWFVFRCGVDWKCLLDGEYEDCSDEGSYGDSCLIIFLRLLIICYGESYGERNLDVSFKEEVKKVDFVNVILDRNISDWMNCW